MLPGNTMQSLSQNDAMLLRDMSFGQKVKVSLLREQELDRNHYTVGRPVIRKVLKIRIWVVPPVCLGSR